MLCSKGSTVPANVLLKAVRNLLNFPYPQVCRHLIALELLSILEQHGTPIAPELATAVCQANDAEALTLLATLIYEQTDEQVNQSQC
jgi:hypothetical protein